jgi:hypothetical protein
MKATSRAALAIFAVAALSCTDLHNDPVGLLTPDQITAKPTVNSIKLSATSAYQMLSSTLNLLNEWRWDLGTVFRNDFIVSDNGELLLSRGPLIDIVWATLVCGAAVGALAVVTTGWMFGPTGLLERVLCVPAALFLLYLEPMSMAIGGVLLVLALGIHLVRRKRAAATAPTITKVPST